MGQNGWEKLLAGEDFKKSGIWDTLIYVSNADYPWTQQYKTLRNELLEILDNLIFGEEKGDSNPNT